MNRLNAGEIAEGLHLALEEERELADEAQWEYERQCEERAADEARAIADEMEEAELKAYLEDRAWLNWAAQYGYDN